jgi:glycerol-3-phosphate dehydrogenase (NAD(P)+)
VTHSIAILGTGAWGCTLAQVASDSGNKVKIWGRNSDVVSEINSKHSNQRFLPGVQLPQSIEATSHIEHVFESADAVILAIPAQSLRENLLNWSDFYPTDLPSISTLKGIEVSTHLRMTQVLQEVIGLDQSKVGFITGPNLAGELSLRQPAGAVGASTNPVLSEMIVEIFKTSYFRVYTSDDLLGCELAAALKNVVALAVGIVVGMGFGENTQAMIITRGLNEVTKLGVALGAHPLTFAGLAGMGDLVATCQSSLSRNRSFGEAIGAAGEIGEAMQKYREATGSSTVEGVASAGAVVEMAHLVGVEIPIIESVAEVVAGRISPMKALAILSEISTGAEMDFREPL